MPLVIRGAQGLSRTIRQLAVLDKTTFHRDAARRVRTRILERTRKRGVDVNGRPFTPLKESTIRSARPKPKCGQKRLPARVRGPGHILEDTGRMLKALTYAWSAQSGRVFFSDPGAERIASYHNSGTQPYTILPGGGECQATVLRIPIVAGGRMRRPRGRKRLSAVPVVAGEPQGIFARRVRHPGLPKREFFGLDESDIAEVIEIAQRQIEAQLRVRGFARGTTP